MNDSHPFVTRHVRLFLTVAILFTLLPWLAQPIAGSSPVPQEIALTMADDGRALELRDGHVLVLQLPANPSTGYLWEITSGEGLVRPIGVSEFVPESDLLGAPGIVTLRLAPLQSGTAQ
ncbi:MAG TPA: protease inhibitor I42 family protein, partial [Anaerolineae bacterium]|nr:protease inhibitor I42 family protein [Anaerolineae bacterium]